MTEREGQAEDPYTGRELGDFVVEEPLGEGSFGTVYRARQRLLEREAALKILQTRLVTTAETANRFLREAQTASSLDHPYAAHIYASGAESDGTLWMAMEYVRGTPLSEYLRDSGPLPLERLVPFLERVCEVVHHAHEEGIVHRDIKPGNIMVLSRSGRLLPKLVDFGVAKALAATADDPPGPADEPETDPLGDARGETNRAPSPEPRDESAHRASLAETLPPTARGANRSEPARAGAESDRPGAASELTQRGQLVGSPYYMAPEQWDDAAAVDTRCDIYALGIVGYEALVGEPPFTGRRFEDLARAHRRAPPPRLPEHLPPELDEVLAVALAKSPQERFGDALSLASALRRAAGLHDARPALPRLSPAIRDHYASAAPWPLAEAVATLDEAAEPRQARDAAWGVAAVLGHYLGLLAVSAWSRFSVSERPRPPEALRRAGTEVLRTEDWVAIARALTAPYGERPELHPIPELVSFFADEDGPEGGDPGFRALAELRDAMESAAIRDDELAAALEDALGTLSGLLRRASFVCDYPPAVAASAGGAHALTGRPRRRPDLSGAAAAWRSEAADVVRVLDADGAPVLSLYPLVQMLAAAPESPPELFFFAGRSARGGKLVAGPLPLERHDDAALEWLRDQLGGNVDRVGVRGGDERAPYLGLEAFTSEHADLFVGREAEVDVFANRSRAEPLLAAVGPSGAGKSSFVQAGVLPALREREGDLRAVIVRPGPAPLAALVSRLRAEGVVGERDDRRAGDDPRGGDAPPDAAARLREDPELLAAWLDRARGDAGAIVIVVDQFEELFTLTRDREEREAFARALESAARSPADPTRVILTLRDDFLVKAESLPPLKARLSHALLLLTTPGREELERIVTEPARRAGYTFEDSALPGRMVAEVEGEPGALALLSFTASMLWEARDRHFRRLPTAAYEEMGGVSGALSHHADALLDGMPPRERRLAREAFRLLVTTEGTRAILDRRELADALGATAEAESAIEHLVKGRLLVVSDGEDGETIEVAHEALFTSWPRLVKWLREDAEGARLREELRAAAVRWDRRGRPRSLLWRDDALAEYRLWRARYPGGLTPVEESFAEASVDEAARALRRRRGAVATAFTLLAAGAAVLFVMSQRAESARELAEEQRSEAERARGQAEEQRREVERARGQAEAVLELQQQILETTDPEAIAGGLVDDLRRASEDTSDPDATRAAFDELAETADPVDAARALFGAHILEPAEALIRRELADSPVVRGRIRRILADVYQTWGDSERALALAQQAEETLREELGYDHLETRAAADARATALRGEGLYDAARDHAEAARARRERALGADHPATLQSMYDLALTDYMQGDYLEAYRRGREVLEERERTLGPDHADTIETMNHLTVTLLRRDEAERARSIAEEAYDRAEGALGPDHEETLMAMNGWANALRAVGELEDARARFESLLDERRRIRGSEHSRTLTTMNDLASTLRAQGEYEEARRLEERALDARRRLFAPEHPHTLVAAGNLAQTLTGLGEFERARALQEDVLETEREVLGEGHPLTLISMRSLGEIYRARGERARARALLEEALAGMPESLGPEHGETVKAAHALAGLLREQGEPRRAREIYSEHLAWILERDRDELIGAIASVREDLEGLEWP